MTNTDKENTAYHFHFRCSKAKHVTKFGRWYYNCNDSIKIHQARVKTKQKNRTEKGRRKTQGRQQCPGC